MASRSHLRPRGEGLEQRTSTVELLFDLVFVFAITQLSHAVIADLSVRGLLHAGFLLLVVWWGWINTTWLANWLEPGRTRVRLILITGALASLLMAAAIPRAFGRDGLLFAIAYVTLQSGRDIGAVLLTSLGHQLRLTFARLLFWSALAGVPWILGGALGPGPRPALWGAALAVDLLAPIIGYPTPRLGRSRTDDYDVEGGHFAERCQGFIIIALGESIVVTGATAAGAGLSTARVLLLMLAFLGTAVLWWLYFAEIADDSREDLLASGQTGRLARDAYTYLHIPIVAGVIVVAVADDLLLAHPSRALGVVGAAAALGGPGLFLLGENLFRLRMTRTISLPRLACVGALALTGTVATHLSAAALVGIATALLVLLALSELYAPGPRPPGRGAGR